MIPSKTLAIQNALRGDWNQAIAINVELLKENSADIETLNRLAFAYAILGNVKDAKKTYQKVLDIDIVNSIALRGIKRLNGITPVKKTKEKGKQTTAPLQITTFINVSGIFLEETGKTKVIDLINIADSKTIAKLRTGESVTLSIKRSRIFVQIDKQYIGSLPDDIGRRLIRFMQGGNTYSAHTKAVKSNKIAIFVRETKRAARFKHQPSFISTEATHLIFEKQKPQGKKA